MTNTLSSKAQLTERTRNIRNILTELEQNPLRANFLTISKEMYSKRINKLKELANELYEALEILKDPNDLSEDDVTRGRELFGRMYNEYAALATQLDEYFNAAFNTSEYIESLTK